MALILAKWEATFPSPHSVKFPLISHSLNQQHFTALLKKPPGAFWSCFLRMTEGKGESNRTEKEEPSFQHPVQQLMQWSCNKDLEKDGACWWWIPEDCKAWETREQAALKDFVYKPCFSTRCDKCSWGKAVAVPARPELQIPVSIPSTGVREGSPGWGESHRQISHYQFLI